MADAALMIGWSRAVVGREQTALELFAESTAFYGRLVSDKKLESFEPVIIGAHGGDLNGFVLIRGTGAQLDALRRSAEFEEIVVRGLLCLEGLGVTDAYVGEGMQRMMANFAKAVAR